MTAEDRYPELTALANGRDSLPTGEAAAYLNREPQTLRKWACTGKGPIQPDRINGRLDWGIQKLRKVREGSAK